MNANIEPTTEQPTLNAEKIENQPHTSKANDNPQGSPLECHICYEESREPVTTTCGHIFCWSCIYKWITAKSSNNYCPMCKNTVTEDKLIPLYPKNYEEDKKNQIFEEGVPKRPRAKREERDTSRHRIFGGPFAGININMPNFAMSIGCLPTLLPILIMVLINIFACIFGDDEEYEVSDHSDNEMIYRGTGTNHDVYGEDDVFDWSVIFLMILFIGLPFILAKLRRR